MYLGRICIFCINCIYISLYKFKFLEDLIDSGNVLLEFGSKENVEIMVSGKKLIICANFNKKYAQLYISYGNNSEWKINV